MPKKKREGQGKTRPREHVLADLSVNYVERRVFLEGFAIERFTRDYGLDLVMTTFDDNAVCGVSVYLTGFDAACLRVFDRKQPA